MLLPEELNVLLLVSILKMTGSAQGHQIFDLVFSLDATHTTAINMMNVNGTVTADFTSDKVIKGIVKVFKVDLCVVLHFQPFFSLA